MMMEQQITIATEQFPALSARLYGREGQPLVVLVHGFPAEGALWRALIPLLPADVRLLVPDLPGVGESAFRGDALSMEDLAAGIAALLDHLQVDRAVLAGHSMGGYAALAFAALYPQRVLGLALIHSTARADDEEKKSNRRKAIGLIRKGGKESFVNAMVPPLFAAAFREAHPDVVEAQRKQALQVADASLIAFYNAMINRPDRLETLRSAAFPVQWIIGAQDSLIPPEKVLQQTTLANVNFVKIYAGSGHMSMLEQPQQLAQDMAAFLTYCIGQPRTH